MACEIERKFLVDLGKWQKPNNGVKIMQGYLIRNMQNTELNGTG